MPSSLSWGPGHDNNDLALFTGASSLDVSSGAQFPEVASFNSSHLSWGAAHDNNVPAFHVSAAVLDTADGPVVPAMETVDFAGGLVTAFRPDNDIGTGFHLKLFGLQSSLGE